MDNNAVSVTQISNYIKSIFLAEEMLLNISVYGEISGLNFSRDIAYFNLKDENAILPCVCFDSSKFQFLIEGNQVVVKGSPSYYIKGGRLSFNVNAIKPYGIGDLYQHFIELKNKLKNEGLFDDEHKKQFPEKIKRIGVATSLTGAVIQDIINVRTRRDPNIDIVIAPCKVQGENADTEICEAVRLLDISNVDIIIIARGGGSFEDLNCFNSEKLAYTIYNTKKFVLSAVGHETDFTICDFVSDMRAPTPSAAAELVTESKKSKRTKLFEIKSRLLRLLDSFLNQDILLKEKIEKLNFIINNKNTKEQNSIIKYNEKLKFSLDSFNNELSYQLGLYTSKLENKNPEFLQKLGYIKVECNNKVIDSVKELSLNDDLILNFIDGHVISKVKEIKEKNI